MAITEPADPRANATSTGGGWGDLEDFDKALESKGFTSVHLKVGCKKAVGRAGRAWCREAGGAAAGPPPPYHLIPACDYGPGTWAGKVGGGEGGTLSRPRVALKGRPACVTASRVPTFDRGALPVPPPSLAESGSRQAFTRGCWPAGNPGPYMRAPPCPRTRSTIFFFFNQRASPKKKKNTRPLPSPGPASSAMVSGMETAQMQAR